MLRILTLLALIAAPLPAIAQTEPAPVATPAPKPVLVRVSLQTSEGTIVLDLEKERAPITTANFLRYVDQKRLDGVVFYRAAQVVPGFGFIQFGVQNAPQRVLPPIAHEPTTKTGVKHTDGAISIARLKPGTAQGDFTIMAGDQPSLDANPDAPGDNLGYAAFGHVVEGKDVVLKILGAPTSPTLGVGAMKGQMIAKPIKVIAARRVK